MFKTAVQYSHQGEDHGQTGERVVLVPSDRACRLEELHALVAPTPTPDRPV